MHRLQVLLLVAMVCADQVAEISWCYESYPRELVQSWKQSASNSSRLLAKLGEEANDGQNIDHVSCICQNVKFLFPNTCIMAIKEVRMSQFIPFLQEKSSIYLRTCLF